MTGTTLRSAGIHHDALKQHLFPGDGLEAVAFALCGRHVSETGELLTVRRIVPVPYEICNRDWASITWPTDFLADLLDEARRKRLGIVKFHSHPSAYDRFSQPDDDSDRETFASVFSWCDGPEPHGSVVMLPDGSMFGRSIVEHEWQPFRLITVVGDDLNYWYGPNGESSDSGLFEAQDQLFGSGTTARLRRLRIGVVGCSGTGSIVIELLARLGAGTLVLVDKDKIEERNLNRIMNSTGDNIGQPKVDVLAEAVRAMKLGTQVVPLDLNLYSPQAVRAIAECDVVFGCMDTAEGRHLLNRIATFYVIPYFDLGVHLAADDKGGISEASGVVHYLQPGRSSLLSRGAYTLEQVRAEGLFRTDPAAYKEQRRAGYIKGVDEKAPAVVSVNSTIASLAVNEFLARIHPFRSCANVDRATIRFNFMETLALHETETDACGILAPHLGRADVKPLLDWPSLSD